MSFINKGYSCLFIHLFTAHAKLFKICQLINSNSSIFELHIEYFLLFFISWNTWWLILYLFNISWIGTLSITNNSCKELPLLLNKSFSLFSSQHRTVHRIIIIIISLIWCCNIIWNFINLHIGINWIF